MARGQLPHSERSLRANKVDACDALEGSDIWMPPHFTPASVWTLSLSSEVSVAVQRKRCELELTLLIQSLAEKIPSTTPPPPPRSHMTVPVLLSQLYILKKRMIWRSGR